jgi:hypothetical protein
MALSVHKQIHGREVASTDSLDLSRIYCDGVSAS